jgi:tetratricopeptide (TPR) repeat protein
MFRDFLGQLLQRIPRQAMPPAFSPPMPIPQTEPAIVNISISRPTFDCAKARSPLAVLICSDREAAQADWDLITASWARYFSLNENDRRRFSGDQDQWFASVARKCRLTNQKPPFPREQISCVIAAYRGRAAAYRSKLTGDALAESKLNPQQLVQVQQALITGGYLDGDADGEFGPATRSAIRQYQQANGFPQSNYLSVTQRQALLVEGQVGTTGYGGNQSALERRSPTWQDSVPDNFPRVARRKITPGGGTWKECELADKDPDRSIAACSKLLRQGRAKAGAFHNRGLAYEAIGNLDQAIVDISAGIRLVPDRAYRWQERGEIYLKQGNFSRAIEDVNEAIRLDPTRAFRFHQRGNAYRATGDLPRAIADYTEAIRLDPIKRLFRFYDRANAFRDVGRYDEALADYETALELEPRNAWVFLERGRAYARMGQMQLALRDFDAALVIDPSNFDLRNAIQEANPPASPNQKVEKTPSPTQPETRSNPGQETRRKAEKGDAQAQLELGLKYASDKEFDQGVIWLRRAADQEYADAQYHLGYMYDNGRGVPKDGPVANEWFQNAAAQGQADAKARLSEAASIIQLARSTMDRSLQEAKQIRTTEARQQLESIIAELAAATDKLPLSDLHKVKDQAGKAARILDEAKEFGRVSDITSSRINAIESQLGRITSDAPLVLDIKSAIKYLKAAQTGTSLSSLQDALRKLNQLYDSNREKLKALEFDAL